MLEVECTLWPCGRPATGDGVENIGGGGMGPISDTGIGGSGSSDKTMWFGRWWCICCIWLSEDGGGVFLWLSWTGK